MKKMWGGRFECAPDEMAERFNASIDVDKRMVRQDITGSIAHARMLGKQGIISAADADAIIAGLTQLLRKAEAGGLPFSAADEDVHMNVERLLTESIGEAGKRLHTGRSRNDQVALDLRMYLKEEIDADIAALKELCLCLCALARRHTRTVMSAYTHLQKAQPTTLAHWLMAYCEMFLRDIDRLADCRKRTDVMPLGSGALCATTYPLDRRAVARELGFSAVTRNSLDGVSDRDFAIEYVSCVSLSMMHMSRLCEELILFSSGEFGYVRMSDQYSTGSSIMPQKKNPDMAELIRGKTGRVYGDLTALLTLMKGLPLAYNKDMQEDKEGVFDAADTYIACLKILRAMLETCEWQETRMGQNAARGFTNATDAADYLVKKGLPFRDAHEVIGKIVLHCERAGISIEQLTSDELKSYSPLFEDDVYADINLINCVDARDIEGGPAEKRVLAHIQQAKEILKCL